MGIFLKATIAVVAAVLVLAAAAAATIWIGENTVVGWMG